MRQDYARQYVTKTNMKQPRPISQFVSQVLPEADDPPADQSIQRKLEKFWRDEIGEAAHHSRPCLFQSGRLVVFCESPAWSTQLRNQAPSILLQLMDVGFPASNIKIRILPASTSRNPVLRRRKKPNPISDENAQSMLEASKKIQHPGLESSLKKLATKFRTTSKNIEPN